MAARLQERVGVRVQRARVELGLTQVDLADALGVDESTVRSIEAGRRGLSLSTLIKVGTVLGLDANDLLGEIAPTNSAAKVAAAIVEQLPDDAQRLAVRLLRDVRDHVAVRSRGRERATKRS